MFKLGGLFVELQAKDAAFNQTLDRAKDRAQATGTAIEGTPFAVGGGAGGTDVGAMAASMGPMAAQLRAALAGALEPLQGMAARLGAMFDRVGGAVITMARRMDQSMKFSASKAAVEKLKDSLANLVKTGANASWPFLRKLQQDLIAIAPAAGVALAGFKALAAARNYFGSRGDVAKRSLSELKGMKFDALAGSARGAAGAVGMIGGAAQRATGHVKAFGGSVLVALGFFGAAYKLVEFFRGGIKGAVDLGETISKTREVFGEFTGTVTAQADAMAKQYGLVKGPLLDAASSIGLIAQGAGLSERASAGMANSLAKLAADASSFYNVPMDEALMKIRAGLVGESEPLRAFGVLLTEEAVAAAAVAQGFARSTKEVDNAAKVKARAYLIEQGLATASGDLERTQSSAANQFRAAGGGLANFATVLGTVLIPAVQSGIGAFQELLASTIEAFESNKGAIEGWVSYLTSAIDTVGMVIRNWPDIWEIVTLQIAERLINLGEYIDTIPANLSIVADYIAGNWRELIRDAFVAFGTYVTNAAKNIGNFATAVQDWLSGKGWKFEWTPLLDGFEATAAALPDLVKPHLTSMQSEIDEVAGRIAEKEKARADALKHTTDQQKKKAEAATVAMKEFKSEESGLADFAAKLRQKQSEGRNEALTSNTSALQQVREAVDLNTEALGKGATAVYA